MIDWRNGGRERICPNRKTHQECISDDPRGRIPSQVELKKGAEAVSSSDLAQLEILRVDWPSGSAGSECQGYIHLRIAS